MSLLIWHSLFNKMSLLQDNKTDVLIADVVSEVVDEQTITQDINNPKIKKSNGYNVVRALKIIKEDEDRKCTLTLEQTMVPFVMLLYSISTRSLFEDPFCANLPIRVICVLHMENEHERYMILRPTNTSHFGVLYAADTEYLLLCIPCDADVSSNEPFVATRVRRCDFIQLLTEDGKPMCVISGLEDITTNFEFSFYCKAPEIRWEKINDREMYRERGTWDLIDKKEKENTCCVIL